MQQRQLNHFLDPATSSNNSTFAKWEVSHVLNVISTAVKIRDFFYNIYVFDITNKRIYTITLWW